MSSTSMSITTFKSIATKLPPNRSVLLRANAGVGKSKVVRQVRNLLKAAPNGAELGEFPLIDRRLSQMSEGDVVGLPSTDGEVTRFNPPDWYKKACVAPCVLFLDELNRATPEVMQAAFQIVLDRELNGHKLHPLTRVFSAVNTAAQYTVNEIDPALLDRFYVIDLDPTPAEFVSWARDASEDGGKLHYFVADFIEGNDRWLYPAKNAEPGSVQPSPRSWEFVDQCLRHAGVVENPGDEAFYHVCRGFVGNEAAIAFKDFCSSIDNQITGDDIINSFAKKQVKAKVDRCSQERLNGVIEKVDDYVTKNCTKLTDAQGKNLAEFMKKLPDELKISLWSKLTAQGIDKLDLLKSVHKACAETLLGIFGVPMGEAGIGIVPNIPGIFHDKQQK